MFIAIGIFFVFLLLGMPVGQFTVFIFIVAFFSMLNLSLYFYPVVSMCWS